MIDIDKLHQALGAVQPEEVEELLDRIEAAESARRDDYQNWMTALDRNAELLEKLEAAEKELAELRSSMKFRTSLIGRTEAERDALRTALTDLLNDLEDRAKWNLEESQRVVACGNGVYMRAKAALEESK